MNDKKMIFDSMHEKMTPTRKVEDELFRRAKAIEIGEDSPSAETERYGGITMNRSINESMNKTDMDTLRSRRGGIIAAAAAVAVVLGIGGYVVFGGSKPDIDYTVTAPMAESQPDDSIVNSSDAPAVTVTVSSDESPAEEEASSAEESAAEVTTTKVSAVDSPAESVAETTTAASPEVEQRSLTGVITTEYGEFNYDQLVNDGLANQTRDGVYYALVNNGGGAAGSVFYTVYTSYDCSTWEKSAQNYREPNGNNTHISLEDGRILVFTYDSAYCEPYPYARILTLNGDAISAEDKQDFFAGVTYEDGTSLADGGHMEYYYVAYDGGYRITVTMISENGNTLVKQYNLDPATLSLQIQ